MKRREFFAANLGAAVVPCIGADDRTYSVEDFKARMVSAVLEATKGPPIPWSDRPLTILLPGNIQSVKTSASIRL